MNTFVLIHNYDYVIAFSHWKTMPFKRDWRLYVPCPKGNQYIIFSGAVSVVH